MQSRYLLPLLTCLTCLGCNRSEPTPDYSHAADFSVTGTLQNTTPITFNCPSPEAKSYSWNFGDGTVLSSEQQPAHTFRKAGTYPVKLTVQSAGGPIVQTKQLTLAAADTLAPVFAKVVGLYRFTKVVSRNYSAGGSVSTTTVTPCDVLATASRNTQFLVVGNTSAGEKNLGSGAPYGALSPTASVYNFAASQGNSFGYNITFKAATDSLTCTTYQNGLGGGYYTTYYGKKQ